MILNPLYRTTKSDKAISLSSWRGIDLPPSNIVDLRKFKNMSATEYFKAIKYRVQSGHFFNAGGEVIEWKTFTSENSEQAVRLLSNIAKSRSENGYSSYLAFPTNTFLEQLGSYNNLSGDRSLMFLRIDNEIIASCFLFRLGDTITSDLHGLNSENSKTYKAYFVMMEAIIKAAIEEGKNFVDFGPTTDEPKKNIECSSIPLTGAIYCNIPLMNSVTKISASKVKV